MSKTLLQLVNTVLPEIGFPQFNTVVGNTNRTAALALAMANREGRSLAQKNWRILVKRDVITTASSAEAYALPDDFSRFIMHTEWNSSNQSPMIGPMSDQFWQADLSGITMVTVDDRYQIRADGNSNRMFIRPVPTSSENVTFFYVANSWCRSAGGTRKSEFTVDTDVNLLDDYVFELGIKWRMLKAQQREWESCYVEYRAELGKAVARDGGLRALSILGPSEDDGLPQGRIPETGFGA